MEERYIGIRQATKQGYAVLKVGGAADFLYPSSELRRGRVQGGGYDMPHDCYNKWSVQGYG